ncbi:fucolectin-1-like [Pimephales promelas]|uniref:fucolectin-1-like n=1 Tax=Pimephales promelas TaxID=90988 RepID=UPI0019559E87|nr:fucolectin-1-like [Pimephales promelas]
MMEIVVSWLILLGLFSVQEQADCAKENLARRGTATQSTTSGSKSADYAIDGGKDFSTTSSTCAVTNWEYYPWWRLDLQSAHVPIIVVVTYRDDSYPGLMRLTDVLFGNSLPTYGHPKCTVISRDPAAFTITYSCGTLEGRYVTIRTWWDTLAVCEVEVYEIDYIKRSVMKLAFNSSANLIDPTVTDQVLEELTSALAVRGITNVTLSWSQTPEEEVIQRRVENDSC